MTFFKSKCYAKSYVQINSEIKNMTTKAEPEIPDTPHLNTELANEGDSNDPYPEFEQEQFEMYRDMGLLPKDILSSNTAEYAKWLEKNHTGLYPDKPDMESVTPATEAKQFE